MRHHATPRHAAPRCMCALTRVRARDRAYAKENGQREREERERRRGPHVFASGSTCTQVHFDGRTEDGQVAADRSVPILVRLSTSLSLRNRTKPVSRHFGANQWRTGAAQRFSSLSVPRRRLYHPGLSLRVRLGKRNQKSQGGLLPLRLSSSSLVKIDVPRNRSSPTRH